MDIAQLNLQEFSLQDDLIYLNHAAVAPWPNRTRRAVEDFARENNQQGSWQYAQWLAAEQQLREQLAELLNAPSPADIALLKNTSEALSMVAYGLDWQAGDNVVISDQEFPSNRIVWESLAQFGVQLRQVDLAAEPDPETALLSACDKHTRLLSISSVQYASGLRVDLQQLGEGCRRRGVLFCVDAIQSLGAVQLDVQAIQADFVMADGHKWLLGPEGLAVFYTHPDCRERLDLRQYGWHMVERVGEYDHRDWQIAHSARRFECGSPNMLGIHALRASLSLLLEVGLAAIEARVLHNTEAMFELLAQQAHLQLLSDKRRGRYAGIVLFRHRQIDNHTLYNYLLQQRILCAERGGGIRFSPHFYTEWSNIAQAIQSANECRGI